MKLTPKYMTMDGKEVAADDPQRAVWYSTNPECFFWTDDWSKLLKVGPGIPCCPNCKMVGMYTTAEDWFDGIKRYDDDHPGYAAAVENRRNRCARGADNSMTSFLGEK